MMNNYIISIEYLIILAVLVYSIIRGTRKYDSVKFDNVIISQDTSQLLKAICCIIIVLHHFSLRRPDLLIGKPLAILGGNFALPIFLILSAYGIAKSELNRPIDNVTVYFKKRILKLLKPFWIVNLVTIILYYIIGGGCSAAEMLECRINNAFSDIGSHELSVADAFLMVIGLHEIDGAMWFVWVTLYSYVIFYISKIVFSIRTQKIGFILLYTLLIAIFGLITIRFDFPAHYYRNLWALVLGMLLAVFEKDILINKTMQISIIAGVTVFLLLQCFFLKEPFYFISAITALSAIVVSEKFISRRSIVPNSFIAMLSGVSYVIYLIHIKVFTIEWYYVGYVSVLIPLIVIVLFAYVFEYLMKAKSR